MKKEIRPKLDEYGAGDMVLPEWRLVQRIGGDWAKGQGANPGQFHNTITDDISDELNIVVVDILEGRTRWGEEIGSEGPECYSLDAKSNLSANGDDCQGCKYRLDTPWSVKSSERRAMCCLNFTIMGIDTDHDNLPVLVRAHGVAVKPVRELITQLKLNRTLKRQYYQAVVNIKSEEKKTAFGSVYTLHPKIIRLVTDESMVQQLRLQSQELLGAPIALPEGRPEEEIAEVEGVEEVEEVGRDVVKEAVAATKPRTAAGKGYCRHGEFDLIKGCPQCIAAARKTTPPVEIPGADLWDNI